MWTRVPGRLLTQALQKPGPPPARRAGRLGCAGSAAGVSLLHVGHATPSAVDGPWSRRSATGNATRPLDLMDGTRHGHRYPATGRAIRARLRTDQRASAASCSPAHRVRSCPTTWVPAATSTSAVGKDSRVASALNSSSVGRTGPVAPSSPKALIRGVRMPVRAATASADRPLRLMAL
ncbi:hypothetical protein SCATT_p04880 (plasmid) [Streptantibioticus cattleyicolor NRRL 8057 = DSM 46488]|uniref:Uncharacterized protein n=1 Tax=Streptantibioticus cattleyicolor (strain ATCC 35852 / DSM 46488 / JCM 4925 / NBRC 14057 / NRRL 8057) TaxID=1003195 RepID=G8XGC3_STREN|nr:hypothetical protein SCATT_p04880 [Streptantibioticus cattleyicolor NRRL 8057 = DSM 46488]